MALEDLISHFESFTNPNEGVTPDIDAVLNGVQSVYNQDMAIRDTVVNDREATIATLEKDKENLMLENYKLLKKQPASNVSGDNDKPELSESERAATVTFAELFKR